MKIVLRAFGNKLSGVMEVPEGTGFKFKLAMTQPINFKNYDGILEQMMNNPIETICEFEWTNKIFSQKGHEWDGAREYQLININKR